MVDGAGAADQNVLISNDLTLKKKRFICLCTISNEVKEDNNLQRNQLDIRISKALIAQFTLG
ncbi:hypothetical protein V1477_010431 [Vespula maculifrons]|uniref:Uncharacterized protein n=1 Tax=Vespula maculifrons TaxID=7453 RepID=A0ABD2C967_VESMC